MNFKKVKKTITPDVVVQATIDGKECSVPMNENNRHYQAILKWVEEGNTIEEAD